MSAVERSNAFKIFLSFFVRQAQGALHNIIMLNLASAKAQSGQAGKPVSCFHCHPARELSLKGRVVLDLSTAFAYAHSAQDDSNGASLAPAPLKMTMCENRHLERNQRQRNFLNNKGHN